MAAGQGAFALDENAVIALAANATAADRRLAAFLAAELSGRRGLALRPMPAEGYLLDVSPAAGTSASSSASYATSHIRRGRR